MSAVREINFVAGVEAKTNGTEMAFDSAARIQNGGDVTRTQIVHGAGECTERGGTTIKHEIHEAAFYRDKRMKTTVAEFEFGTKQTVKGAHIGTSDRDCGRKSGIVGETFVENPVEVVAHFALEFELPVYGERGAGTEAGEICIGLGQAEIVGVNAELDMVSSFLILSECRWRNAYSHEDKKQDTLHAKNSPNWNETTKKAKWLVRAGARWLAFWNIRCDFVGWVHPDGAANEE